MERYISMKEPVKLSVIICFYNSEQYVESCLESVQSQSLRELEILAIDDGSTDGTWEKIQQVRGQDSRVKMIHKKNGGLASSRRLGMEEAVGEYITFVDGDDWLASDIYEKMYSSAKQQDLDIVQCNIVPTGDMDSWKDMEAGREYPKEVIEGENLLYMYLERKVMPALWQRIFKRNLLLGEEFKIISPVMSDHFNFPEWAIRAKRVQILTDAGYYWLTRKGSLGQPEGKIQAAHAKNRFLSGISILGFSQLRKEAYQSAEVRYLMSYMTQTAFHLQRTALEDYKNVYHLWESLKEPYQMYAGVMSLPLDESGKKFFRYLEEDHEAFEDYVRGDFLLDQSSFIENFRYNGDDLFHKS